MPRAKVNRGVPDPPVQPQEGRMTRARQRDAVPPPPPPTTQRAEQLRDAEQAIDEDADTEASQPVPSYGPPARRSARMLGERAPSLNLDNIQPSDAGYTDNDDASQFNAEENADDDEPSDGTNASAVDDDQGESMNESQLDDEAVEVQSLVLDDLNQASSTLIDKIFREHKPKPEIWKRLIAVHRRPFAELRRIYVEESVPFINLYDSVKPLSEDIQWKAQGIFASANLASLLDEISDPSLDPTILLQRLDQDFPAPFVPWMDEPRLAGEEWGVTDVMVELALSIRTQRLIFAVEHTEQFDIERAVAAIFSAEDDSHAPQELLIQDKMAAICCQGQPLDENIAAVCYERVNSILETASRGRTPAEIVDLLRARFPVKGWISAQIDWAYEHFAEVQRIIHGNSRVDEGGAPSRSVAGSEGSQTPSQFSQPIIRPQRPGHSIRITNSSVARLMQLEEAAGMSQEVQSSAPAGDGDTAADKAPARPTSPSPQHNHLRTNRNARRSPPASPASTTGSSSYENAILSRIPSSSRVMSSQTRVSDSQPLQPVASNFQRVNNWKRGRDDDASEDDFEQDLRDHDIRRRAEQDRRAMPPPPLKRPRHDAGPSSSAGTMGPPASSTVGFLGQSSRPSGPRPSFFDDDDEADPSDFALVRNSACPDWRVIQQRNRSQTPAPPRLQQRIPWSNRDVSRLIELIPIHGCCWTDIAKSANPFIPKEGEPGTPEAFDPSRHFNDRRDQQAIRDKARNLKVDLLKADLILPPGFDKVTLGKKEREVLIGRGKNPERRETDIDVDGNPVNTEFDDAFD